MQFQYLEFLTDTEVYFFMIHFLRLFLIVFISGKEVAKFVKLKYPEVLVALESFRAGDIETALRESFHKIDELLEDEQHHELLKQLRALPNPSDSFKESEKSKCKFVFHVPQRTFF